MGRKKLKVIKKSCVDFEMRNVPINPPDVMFEQGVKLERKPPVVIDYNEKDKAELDRPILVGPYNRSHNVSTSVMGPAQAELAASAKRGFPNSVAVFLKELGIPERDFNKFAKGYEPKKAKKAKKTVSKPKKGKTCKRNKKQKRSTTTKNS